MALSKLQARPYNLEIEIGRYTRPIRSRDKGCIKLLTKKFTS